MRIEGLTSFSNAKCAWHRSLLIRRTFYAFDVTPLISTFRPRIFHQRFSLSRLIEIKSLRSTQLPKGHVEKILFGDEEKIVFEERRKKFFLAPPKGHVESLFFGSEETFFFSAPEGICRKKFLEVKKKFFLSPEKQFFSARRKIFFFEREEKKF
jgi:hypothetical protein